MSEMLCIWHGNSLEQFLTSSIVADTTNDLFSKVFPLYLLSQRPLRDLWLWGSFMHNGRGWKRPWSKSKVFTLWQRKQHSHERICIWSFFPKDSTSDQMPLYMEWIALEWSLGIWNLLGQTRNILSFVRIWMPYLLYRVVWYLDFLEKLSSRRQLMWYMETW